MIRTLVRRLVKAAIVGGAGALVYTWFRSREPEIVESQTPGSAQWTPLAPAPTEGAATDAGAVTGRTAEAPSVAEPSDGTAAEPPRSDWVAPESDGGCPASHPVKVKLRSGIYHVPDGLAYDRTNADRCYPSPDAAEADGYRASKM